MASQKDLDSTYMGVAMLHAKLSKARRSRVGACLVTSQGVCLGGFNGSPVGLSNQCEDVVSSYYCNVTKQQIEELVTKPETLHAEKNAILKSAREGVSCLGSTMYVTLSPCVSCSAMLINAGITRLAYQDIYRDTEGLDLLQQAGIITEQFKE